MNQTYYVLTAPVRPGFALPSSALLKKNKIVGTTGAGLVNPNRWIVPRAKENLVRRDSLLPHVFLANADYPGEASPRTVLTFVNRYGPIASDLENIPEEGESFETLPLIVGYHQNALRRAWHKPTAENLKALWFGLGGEELTVFFLPVTYTAGGLELRPAECWTYLRLLFLRDLENKRARLCANPTCPAPFFVAKRNNQKFCGWDCTNLVQQRNFRKRRTAK